MTEWRVMTVPGFFSAVDQLKQYRMSSFLYIYRLSLSSYNQKNQNEASTGHHSCSCQQI